MISPSDRALQILGLPNSFQIFIDFHYRVYSILQIQKCVRFRSIVKDKSYILFTHQFQNYNPQIDKEIIQCVKRANPLG